MSKERRYNEKEIAAIFKQAAADFDSAQKKVQSGEGLTLEEIEEIGKEVGIMPEFISRAAAKVDQRFSSPEERKIGRLPIQVNRVVDLPASFSDSDWDRLVVDLHDTFNVIGAVQDQGRIRAWSTETMQVRVEPSGSGYRLRMTSNNSIDVLLLVFGSVFFFVSMMFMIAVVSKGNFFVQMDDTLISLILTALGISVGSTGLFRLPGWHHQEAQKMDAVVARVLAPQEEEASLQIEDNRSQSRIDLEDVGLEPESHPVNNRARTKSK